MNPPKDDGLINSYQLFYGAIKEQADGLVKTNSIDAFFAVPAGRFRPILTTTTRVFSRPVKSGPMKAV